MLSEDQDKWSIGEVGLKGYDVTVGTTVLFRGSAAQLLGPSG